jgi:SNF2 family DNA or RNA helicase
VIDIRFVRKLGEPEAAVDKFNDKGSDVEILTTSASVNLQNDCNHVIFMSVFGNASICLQAIGCVFRLRQWEK